MAVSLRFNRKEEPFVGSMVKRNRGFSREILTTPRKMEVFVKKVKLFRYLVLCLLSLVAFAASGVAQSSTGMIKTVAGTGFVGNNCEPYVVQGVTYPNCDWNEYRGEGGPAQPPFCSTKMEA